MRRAEALSLVGKIVRAGTGFWGDYIGECLEITPHRPWRARVRVLAVVKYPTQGLDLNRGGGSVSDIPSLAVTRPTSAERRYESTPALSLITTRPFAARLKRRSPLTRERS